MGRNGALAPRAAQLQPCRTPLAPPLLSPLFSPAHRKGTSIFCSPIVNHPNLIGHPVANTSWGMGKVTIAFVVVIVLLLLGGGIFLLVWNPPAPTAPVEKVLPDARFPK